MGQLAASTGFALYSWLLGNWVFLVTNVALLATAVAGEIIYLANRSELRPYDTRRVRMRDRQ